MFKLRRLSTEMNMPNGKNKLKVLRIISRLNIGGPSIHVALLCRKLKADTFESILATGSISPSEGDMGYLIEKKSRFVRSIPQLKREIEPLNDLIAFFKLLRIVMKEKPNIIHTHTAKAGTIGRLGGIFYKCLSGRELVMVHTFHGNVFEGYFGKIKSRLFAGIERILARFTDVVIAISPTQQWELVSKYRIADGGKVHTINLGFDLSSFTEAKAKKCGAFRQQWKIQEETILIGIVGRLVPIKNHKLFLDAAKRFVVANSDMPVRFVVVGDGELREQLEAYVQEIGLGDKVLFCGWQKDIPTIYADLDILALTSFNEGTPVSIIEAMAAGVPVITTDAGGVKDLLGPIHDNQSGADNFQIRRRGIMCPSTDPSAFAEGVRHLLQDAKGKGRARTESARDYVRLNYSQDRLVNDIEALYERLVRV